MDYSNNNGEYQYKKVEYNALANKTYETLDRSVFNADIGGSKLGLSDTIMEILPARLYYGKEPSNGAKIVFIINVCTLNPSKPTNKIVIIIDGERLELSTVEDCVDGTKRIGFLPEEIIGLEPGERLVTERRGITFVLEPEDIKRIAEAKNIGLYIDASTLHDANGGDFKFRNGRGSFQIEGLQGAMKRAYHFFVDETCYVDYCNSYYDKAKSVRRELAGGIEERKRKEEQKEIDEERLWYKVRNKYLIILAILAGVVILGGILENAFDIITPTWLIWVIVLGGFYCVYKLYCIGAIFGGDGNDSNEDDA